MLKRNTIVIVTVSVLCIGIAAQWSASSAGKISRATDETVSEGRESDARLTNGTGGKGFVGILRSPFRVFGKLFGRSENKPTIKRMTERDAEEFVSVGVARVTDSHTTPPPDKTVDYADAQLNFERGRQWLDDGHTSAAIAYLTRDIA